MNLRYRLKSPITFAKAIWCAFQFLIQGRPVIAPQMVRVDRMLHCAGCEHNDNGMCAQCGCLIDAKTYLSSEQCPDNPPRWKSLTDHVITES